MNGLLLLAIAAALLLTAYLVYGRYLVKTWGIDPKAKTPAYEKEDGTAEIIMEKAKSEISLVYPKSAEENSFCRYYITKEKGE